MIWHHTREANAARKARHYYSIILFFILGAAVGARLTDTLGERALLLTCAPLLAVFVLMFRKEEAHIYG